MHEPEETKLPTKVTVKIGPLTYELEPIKNGLRVWFPAQYRLFAAGLEVGPDSEYLDVTVKPR